MTDDASSRNIAALCRSFIGVFPALLKNDVLTSLEADGIYRQACRSLASLIWDEIVRGIEGDGFRAATSRQAKGSLDAYLQSLSLEQIVDIVLRETKFTERFHGYCSSLLEYWPQIEGRPSILSLLGMQRDDE